MASRASPPSGYARAIRPLQPTSNVRERGGVRVAVVIPCYGDGATLEEALASLESQEPCEVVVVDDGSTDETTLTVLDRVGQRGVRVLRQENAGPGAARMAGVAATTAPYVFPLDADDVLASAALTALADVLDTDPQLAVAWGDTQTFGRAEVRVRKGPELDPWLVTYVNNVPAASLVRRSALLEVGGWQLRSGYEDWDLWLGLAEGGFRGARIPRVTVFYRLHQDRRWAENRARHDDIFTELRKRHRDLFASRRHNWLRSRAPLRARLLLPLIDVLPLSAYERHRLADGVLHPLRVLRVGLAQATRRHC